MHESLDEGATITNGVVLFFLLQEVNKNLEFLLLATDGLWDVVSNQRAVDIVRTLLVKKATPEEAAGELVKEANRQGTRDNIAALVLVLQPLPLPPKKVPPRRNPNSRLRLAPRSELRVEGSSQNL
ncbi:hypothetical protein BSKO_05812 [Bryopsis sp. KO-2023]|nr:hypothetical protein BSKO_05812 [Bryopsis sp. KO-2023]